MSTEQIEQRRKLSMVSEVNQWARIPAWLGKKIKAAVKAQKVDFCLCPFTTAGALVKLVDYCRTSDTYVAASGERFELPAGSTRFNFLDHCGTAKIDGKLCYVSEPYPGMCKNEYEPLLSAVTYKLSRLLDCDVTWSRQSWHYPNVTYRILFQRWNHDS